MDDDKLIGLVREHEILYDKSKIGYRFPEKKVAAWLEISREMGYTEEECSRRWTTLRERFSRELRKLDAPSGSAAGSQDVWPLMENLSFLKPHVKPRPVRHTVNILDESATTISLPESPEPPPSGVNRDIPAKSKPAQKRKRNKSDLDDEFKQVCELYKETHNDRMKNKPLRAFGDMVVETLSEMNDFKQARAIQAITDTIMSIKLEEDYLAV